MSRMVLKSPAEIAIMHEANLIIRRIIDELRNRVRPGLSTAEIDSYAEERVRAAGATPAPLNYRGYPKSVCTSINEVVCHGIPGDRRLKNGDMLNIDITVIKDGFHGDTSKIFFVGEPSLIARRLAGITYECMTRGIAAVKPGAQLGDIGHTIQRHAEAHNYSVVREYCGHGIGREFHEDPQVLHYGRPGSGLILQAGMTFTIEPMINTGKRYTKVLRDGWTVVTKDHSLSAQWEHTILVTEDGYEGLTLRNDEDI